MKTSWTTRILWAIFIFILLVLIPHTAWAFRQLEPGASTPVFRGTFTWADLVSYIAAIAIEAAIAALVYKLSEHIKKTKQVKRTQKNQDGSHTQTVDAGATWRKRYINVFSLALIVVTTVSALANLAHAVQFGQKLAIFTKWGVPEWIYSVALGGILPFVSLIFAWVLSEVSDDEAGVNPELEAARATIRSLNQRLKETEGQVKAALQSAEDKVKQIETQVRAALQSAEDQVKQIEEQMRVALQESEGRVKAAEDRARIAEERFNAAGDLLRWMFIENKSERILIVKQQWPALSQQAVAVLTDSSPALVSQVLSGHETVAVEQGSGS
jgi:uncharacterized membrane protein